MPRLPTFRNALAATTMAVVALCGGGKALAEQKGTLSVFKVEFRESAIERHLNSLANDIRRALREAGRIRRGKPNVSGETVSVKIKKPEDFDRAAEALSTLSNSHFFTLEGERSSQRFIFTGNPSLRSALATKLQRRVKQQFKGRIFNSSADLMIKSMTENRFAIFYGEDASLRYHPHGLRIHLDGFFGVISSFEPYNPKFKKEVGTTISDDAHNSEKHWVVSSVPLIKSLDIVSATPASNEDVPSINFLSMRPAKDFSLYYLDNEPLMMAMVVDGKVFGTRKLSELKLLRSFNFPTGLTPTNTRMLAAEIDPLHELYEFVTLDECERVKPRDLRGMTC